MKTELRRILAESARLDMPIDTLSDSAEGMSKEARELIVSLNKLVTPENRERLSKTLASLEKAAANLDALSQKLPSTVDRANASHSGGSP